MNLKENPIFLTQQRLVHRGGVLAAILVAALIGLSLLSGVVAYRANPLHFPDFNTAQEAGKVFYGWTIGVEILVLVIFGGFGRVSRALAEERKAGLWDSNRLTPLSPSQLITGYWLGPALREFYMALVLAGAGLLIVLLAQLPLTLWLGTQFLILSTALFSGLLAITTALALQRPQQGGIVAVLAILFLQPFSFAFPRFELTNFLLPTYGIANFFTSAEGWEPRRSSPDWIDWPSVFGLPTPPILLTLCLQLGVGIFLWRAAVRKAANPFQPLIPRWEAVAIFGILLLAQHGLIWNLWHGHFPTLSTTNPNSSGDFDILLPAVYCGTMVLGFLILATSSPQPETVRVTALRRDVKSLGAIFSRSAVSLALILGAVAAAVSSLQFARAAADSWFIYLIGAGNLISAYLIFALLFEFCRLRHRGRSMGFLALWMFVFCLLPFILAGVFTNLSIAKWSLLAPAVTVLADWKHQNVDYLAGIVFAHFSIALLLWIAWEREWRQLLIRASVQNSVQNPVKN